MYIADQDYYLDGSISFAVPCHDPRARFWLIGKGQSMDPALAKRYGLDNKQIEPAEDKQLKPAEDKAVKPSRSKKKKDEDNASTEI